jgi:hypothetical protein
MRTAVESQSLSLFTEIIEITTLAVRADRSHRIVDGVTIVRGYAELSAMYPAISGYRLSLRRSVMRLADLLESKGSQTLKQRARSIADSLC